MTALILACAGAAFVGALFGAAAGVIVGYLFVQDALTLTPRRHRGQGKLKPPAPASLDRPGPKAP